MKKMRMVAVPIVLALSAACDSTLDIQPVEDYRRMINVFCILRSNQPRQWVMVERTLGMKERIGGPFSGRISSAEVRIKGGSQDVLLTTYPQNPGYYFTDSLTVHSGETYTLEVFDSYDSTTVTGQTLVPEPIELISPVRGKYPVNEGIQVTWTASRQVSHYLINLRYHRGTQWSASKYFNTDRTSYQLLPFLFAFPGDYLIEVVAMDENYYLYTLGNTGSESTQEVVRLDGGLGVFGAAAADSAWIIVGEHSILYTGEF